MVAGAAKLSRPAGDSAGLFGFRARTGTVRLIAVLEVAVGASALLVGTVAAWAVGLLYAAFALVVVRAVRGGAASCGCFGRLDAPPSLIHVAGNLALAAASFAAAAGSAPAPIPAIVQATRDAPAVGIALAAAVASLAGLVLASFTALPEALAAARPRGRLGPGTGSLGGAGLFRAIPPAERP